MAKKATVNKSQAVRDYLAAHADAMPKDIITALGEQGIEVSRVLVSTIKGKLKKAGKAKKAAKPAPEVVPATVEKPAGNSGTITLEQVKKVAQMIKTLGGLQRVTEVLAVIKELGGVKKFRDLAEAMTVTGTDDVPF